MSARGLVVARAHSGPGGQAAGGGRPGHVGTDLGQDDFGGAVADSGDGDQQVDLVLEGGDLPGDLGAEVGLGRGGGVDAVQHGPGHEGVMVGEVAGAQTRGPE